MWGGGKGSGKEGQGTGGPGAPTKGTGTGGAGPGQKCGACPWRLAVPGSTPPRCSHCQQGTGPKGNKGGRERAESGKGKVGAGQQVSIQAMLGGNTPAVCSREANEERERARAKLQQVRSFGVGAFLMLPATPQTTAFGFGSGALLVQIVTIGYVTSDGCLTTVRPVAVWDAEVEIAPANHLVVHLCSLNAAGRCPAEYANQNLIRGAKAAKSRANLHAVAFRLFAQRPNLSGASVFELAGPERVSYATHVARSPTPPSIRDDPAEVRKFRSQRTRLFHQA